MAPFDAVLFIAFGGPETPADVRPFLDNVLRGRPVPRERYEEVVRHYEIIGGRSPLNALTVRQAEGVARVLAAEGPALPVYVGMRNWSPYIADTLAGMTRDGARRVLGVILAPHRSEASWERYVADVEAGRLTLGGGAPEIEYARPWFDHPRFIAAVADRVRDAFVALGHRSRTARVGEETPAMAAEDADRPAIVFTAHSIPVAMADASPYVRDLRTSCRLVAEALGGLPYTLAYQSRSGNPREPWLEPDVNDAIRSLAMRGVPHVVVVPIGFVCDHVEVLYDLDIEAKTLADQLGIELRRAATVNDHPLFIAMMAEVIRSHVGKA